MAHAENEVIINKPVDEVYQFLADGTNNTRWRSGVVSISLVSGSAGAEGAEYTQMVKGPGGRPIAADYRITVARPGNELSFVVITGPARPKGSYYFENVAGRTKLRFVLDFEPKGIARLLGPMVAKTMQSEVAQLVRLKEVLETAAN
jgi:uncharacterized membrane protein